MFRQLETATLAVPCLPACKRTIHHPRRSCGGMLNPGTTDVKKRLGCVIAGALRVGRGQQLTGSVLIGRA